MDFGIQIHLRDGRKYSSDIQRYDKNVSQVPDQNLLRKQGSSGLELGSVNSRSNEDTYDPAEEPKCNYNRTSRGAPPQPNDDKTYLVPGTCFQRVTLPSASYNMSSIGHLLIYVDRSDSA